MASPPSHSTDADEIASELQKVLDQHTGSRSPSTALDGQADSEQALRLLDESSSDDHARTLRLTSTPGEIETRYDSISCFTESGAFHQAHMVGWKEWASKW